MKEIKYMIIDVDGTMTDSGIYYDDYGNELKKFSTKDAVGFFAAQKAGIEVIVLTGRECPATTRRMQELKADLVIQNVSNKFSFLHSFMKEHEIERREIGYIGDDLNDLAPMSLVGFIGCPKYSCKEILKKADYVSGQKGGQGAVRDIIEYLLKERGEWNEIIGSLYDTGK